MKTLSLNERAEAARRRLMGRGKAWDNALHGYLAGHRAAKRAAAKEIKLLKKQIEYQTKRADTARDDANRYSRDADRFEQALRDYARGAINETRHPFKELRP